MIGGDEVTKDDAGWRVVVEIEHPERYGVFFSQAEL